jgi:hypothetical protein
MEGGMALTSGNSGTAGKRAEMALVQAQLRPCFPYGQNCAQSSTETEVGIEQQIHISKSCAFANNKCTIRGFELRQMAVGFFFRCREFVFSMDINAAAA